jgi:hypothetical protein
MSNPFNWTFDKVASAHALFFNNDHNQRALRLECPDLALEFTDGAYIGRGKSSCPKYIHTALTVPSLPSSYRP